MLSRTHVLLIGLLLSGSCATPEGEVQDQVQDPPAPRLDLRVPQYTGPDESSIRIPAVSWLYGPWVVDTMSIDPRTLRVNDPERTVRDLYAGVLDLRASSFLMWSMNDPTEIQLQGQARYSAVKEKGEVRVELMIEDRVWADVTLARMGGDYLVLDGTGGLWDQWERPGQDSDWRSRRRQDLRDALAEFDQDKARLGVVEEGQWVGIEAGLGSALESGNQLKLFLTFPARRLSLLARRDSDRLHLSGDPTLEFPWVRIAEDQYEATEASMQDALMAQLVLESSIDWEQILAEQPAEAHAMIRSILMSKRLRLSASGDYAHRFGVDGEQEVQRGCFALAPSIAPVHWMVVALEEEGDPEALRFRQHGVIRQGERLTLQESGPHWLVWVRAD